MSISLQDKMLHRFGGRLYAMMSRLIPVGIPLRLLTSENGRSNVGKANWVLQWCWITEDLDASGWYWVWKNAGLASVIMFVTVEEQGWRSCDEVRWNKGRSVLHWYPWWSSQRKKMVRSRSWSSVLLTMVYIL